MTLRNCGEENKVLIWGCDVVAAAVAAVGSLMNYPKVDQSEERIYQDSHQKVLEENTFLHHHLHLGVDS
jgi:hypothetical protein